MRYRTSTSRRAGWLLALVALAGVRPGGAQGSDAVLRDFHRISDYVLVVNGKEALSAEIYQTEKVPAILVISSTLPAPVLLTPRGGTVETVHIMKVAKQPDGTVDLLADAILAPQGRFNVVGEDVEFTVEGKRARLKSKPPLLGLADAGKLKAHTPEYGTKAQAYTPDSKAIAALKKTAAPVRVRVVFGSWCPHCKRYLPHMLKVEEQLRGSKLSFEYFGIAQDWSDPEIKRLAVKEVPTGIVYVNGKEVGRLSHGEWERPEAALSRILNVRTASSGR